MINIIWQTQKGPHTTNFYDFVRKVLFRDIDCVDYFDELRYETILDNSVIIYSCFFSYPPIELVEYLKKFKAKGYKFGLYHLSNEYQLPERIEYDHYLDAEFVLRQYYDDRITCDNTYTLPIGFLAGYHNVNGEKNLSEQRDIVYSFIGQVKSDRVQMLNSLNGIEPKFLHITKDWADPNGLTPKDVIEIYKKTLFIPCPMGYCHIETLRLYEALEWGCIPIIKKYNGEDYYLKIFGKHPIPVINEWSEIIETMERIRNGDIDKLMLEINSWYSEFNDTVRDNVGEIVCRISY